MERVDSIESSHSADSRGHMFQSLSGLLASAIALPIVVSFATVAWRGIFYPGPTSFAEGNQIHAVLRVALGMPLYLDYRQMPAIVSPYAPFMFLVDGALTRLLGLDIGGAVTLSRAVTLLATSGLTVLIALSARLQGVRWYCALAAAACFLGAPFLDGWAFTTRADALAIAVSMLASYLLVRQPGRPWLAAVVSVLAFFTKQTMISFPPAACLWLWLSGRRGAAVVFGFTWGLVAGGLFLIGQVVSGGNLALNIIQAHLNPTNGFDVAVRAFLGFPRVAWLPLMLAIVGLISLVRRQRLVPLMGWYWLVSLAFTLYTLRGRGADVNYFIEPMALTCVLAASGFQLLTFPVRIGSLRVGLTAVSLVALGIWSFGASRYWWTGGGVVSERPLSIPEVAQAERVLSEEPTFVVLAGKPLLVSEGFGFSQMYEAGHYDPTEVVRLIKQRFFDLIIIRGDARSPRYQNGQVKWIPAMLREIADNYSVKRTEGGFWIYVPQRSRSSS